MLTHINTIYQKYCFTIFYVLAVTFSYPAHANEKQSSSSSSCHMTFTGPLHRKVSHSIMMGLFNAMEAQDILEVARQQSSLPNFREQAQAVIPLLLNHHISCLSRVMEHYKPQPANASTIIPLQKFIYDSEAFTKDTRVIDSVHNVLVAHVISHKSDSFEKANVKELGKLLRHDLNDHVSVLDVPLSELQQRGISKHMQAILSIANALVDKALAMGASLAPLLSEDIVGCAKGVVLAKAINKEDFSLVSPLAHYLMRKKVPLLCTPSDYVTLLSARDSNQIPLLLEYAQRTGSMNHLCNTLPFRTVLKDISQESLPDELYAASRARPDAIGEFFASSNHGRLYSGVLGVIIGYDTHPGDDVIQEGSQKQRRLYRVGEWAMSHGEAMAERFL